MPTVSLLVMVDGPHGHLRGQVSEYWWELDDDGLTSEHLTYCTLSHRDKLSSDAL